MQRKKLRLIINMCHADREFIFRDYKKRKYITQTPIFKPLSETHLRVSLMAPAQSASRSLIVHILSEASALQLFNVPIISYTSMNIQFMFTFGIT